MPSLRPKRTYLLIKLHLLGRDVNKLSTLMAGFYFPPISSANTDSLNILKV